MAVFYHLTCNLSSKSNQDRERVNVSSQIQRRLLGLVLIGDESSDEIDSKVSRLSVSGVLNLRDILELIVHRFDPVKLDER